MSVMITMMIMMQWGTNMIISTKLNLVPTVILIGGRSWSGPDDIGESQNGNDFNDGKDDDDDDDDRDLGKGRVDDIDGLAESSTAESGEYEYRL